MTDRRPPSDEEHGRVRDLIDRSLAGQLEDNPAIAEAVHDTSDGDRWFVRVLGETKDSFAIWFALRQRSLFYETFVFPEPDDNRAEFFDYLLRRNDDMYGAAFVIGAEDGVYLKGQLPLEAVTDEHLDRIIGSFYSYIERSFRPALQIGFASRLNRQEPSSAEHTHRE